jgi:hypothetical protein
MLNLPQLAKFFRTSFLVLLDVLTVFRTGLRSRGALAAENLFLEGFCRNDLARSSGGIQEIE